MRCDPNKFDGSGGLPARISSFSVIEDPRTGGNKLHHFGKVLFMAVSAMLCGMNCFSDIEDFCDLQSDWLRKWIKVPNGVPRACCCWFTICGACLCECSKIKEVIPRRSSHPAAIC